MNQSIALLFLDSSESIIHNRISWKYNYEGEKKKSLCGLSRGHKNVDFYVL